MRPQRYRPTKGAKEGYRESSPTKSKGAKIIRPPDSSVWGRKTRGLGSGAEGALLPSLCGEGGIGQAPSHKMIGAQPPILQAPLDAAVTSLAGHSDKIPGMTISRAHLHSSLYRRFRGRRPHHIGPASRQPEPPTPSSTNRLLANSVTKKQGAEFWVVRRLSLLTFSSLNLLFFPSLGLSRGVPGKWRRRVPNTRL